MAAQVEAWFEGAWSQGEIPNPGSASSRLNPTVDLSGLPLDIEVTQVRIESVTLRLGVTECATPREPFEVAKELNMSVTVGMSGW